MLQKLVRIIASSDTLTCLHRRLRNRTSWARTTLTTLTLRRTATRRRMRRAAARTRPHARPLAAAPAGAVSSPVLKFGCREYMIGYGEEETAARMPFGS